MPDYLDSGVAWNTCDINIHLKSPMGTQVELPIHKNTREDQSAICNLQAETRQRADSLPNYRHIQSVHLPALNVTKFHTQHFTPTCRPRGCYTY